MTVPECLLSSQMIELGIVQYGASTDGGFAIQNTGGGTLSGALSGAVGDFAMIGPTTFSITHGQWANLAVRFSPSTAGAQACTLSLGAAACAPVVVRGTGELEFHGQCGVDVTSPTIDFGEVGIGLTATATSRSGTSPAPTSPPAG